MRNSINLLAGVWVATCCATTVQAQIPADDLFELSLEELMGMEVEIATGTKKSLSKAPAVVTLITADDLKKTGYTNAIEALEMVPGIHVRFNRMGYSPFIHFRGVNTNQTLLMINGQSMRSHASSWAQDQFWKGLPVSAVERIEVVRGPGSVLYEANSNAGVINIITKTAGIVDESEMGVRTGQFGNQEVWGQRGFDWNGFSAGVTAGFSTTDGHEPVVTINSATKALDLGWKHVDLRGYLASDLWRIQADYMRQSDVKIGLNGEGLFDESAKGDTTRMNFAWLFKDQNYSDDWGLDAELRYQKLKFDAGAGYIASTDTNGNSSDGNLNQEGATEQQIKTEISGLFTGVANHAIRLGGGINYETTSDILDVDDGVVDSNPAVGFIGEHSRTTHSVFVQDVWQINSDWELTAGNRWDHYTDFGNTSNARLALVWQTSDQLITKIMYGEGFRPPTFREINNPSGDPVKAEKTTTHELAFNWKATESLTLGTNLFIFNIEDQISGSSEYSNKAEFTTRGIEVEGTWQPHNNLRFSGNITARNPDNNNARKDYEPDKDAYLRMDWRYKPEWNLNLQANWTAGRDRKDGDNRSDMDNNFIVDSTVRYSGLKEWELAASIRNLFDDDAMEHSGSSTGDLPLPERNLFLEARYKF